MVRSGLRYGSLTVSEFHEILRGPWALKFHRVPQSSATIPHGFHKAPQCSTKGSRNVLQGSVVCPARPSTEKPSDQDWAEHQAKPKSMAFGTLSLFVTCSLAQANVGFVANQTTSLRDSRCSRVDAWHCCLVGFGFQEFHEAARAMRQKRSTRLPPGSAKAMGQPCSRTVCAVHRA